MPYSNSVPSYQITRENSLTTNGRSSSNIHVVCLETPKSAPQSGFVTVYSYESYEVILSCSQIILLSQEMILLIYRDNQIN